MMKKILLFFFLIICVIGIVSIDNCLLSLRVKNAGDITGLNRPENVLLSSLYPLELSGNPTSKTEGYGAGIKRMVIVANSRYYEYSGCIHIHTTYSDGGGTYGDIAAAADSLGLDFIIPTDHNTLRPLADGWAKRVGGVLIIPAVENSTDNGAGHFLAIGDSLSLVRSVSVPSDSVYRDTLRRGNMIFLAHVFHPAHNAWRNWDKSDYTGMEMFNLDENWRQNFHPLRINRLGASALVYWYQNNALNYLLSYPRKQMEKFDELNMTRRVVGIGSVDAHSMRLFAANNSTGFPSYTSMFQLVQTTIISREPFDGSYRHDRKVVLTALRQGNCYVGFSGLEDTRGFLFTALSDSIVATCGDSLRMGNETRMRIVLPERRNITVQLVRNGAIVREYRNEGSFECIVSNPGVYRVQVFQDRIMLPFLHRYHFPWILSNPIYLYREPAPVVIAFSSVKH